MMWVRIFELFAVAGFAGLSFLGVHIMQGGKKSAIIVAILASVSLLFINTVLEGETGKGIALTAYCEVRDCKTGRLAGSSASELSEFLDGFDEERWQNTNSTEILASALELYDKKTLIDLAKAGDSRAARLVGAAYSIGMHNFKKNSLLALQFNQICADEGSRSCMHNLAAEYYKRGSKNPSEYTKASYWYHKAARLGELNSHASLGSLYYYGRGVKQNYAEAKKYLKYATDNGAKAHAYLLGDIYEFARSYPFRKIELFDNQIDSPDPRFVDYPNAIKYYRIAAQQGDQSAQVRLGFIYEYRLKNKNEAIRYYTMSAKQGGVFAQEALQRMGITVETEVPEDIVFADD
ncbi:tetratricopeptide repeat protein [Parasphingorhabdus sp.]|uniref:tetratricopeptide repeat protein n=1 Tax=Parasphingorhabdus sp. TaxID=2709688 RepID=UPI003A8DA1FE